MSDTLNSPANPAAPTAAPRLLSLDALRGFDMFWIVGGDELVHRFAAAFPVAPLKLIDGQMDHVAWRGVAFYDLIFPLFVFMAGISAVFSLGRTIQKYGSATAIKRIFFRSLIIYFLGVLVYKGLANGVDQIRWVGVLQRIAISYFFTGLLFCTLPLRGMVAVCVAILLGYWGVMTFVPVRDFNLETAHLAQTYAQAGSTNTVALFQAATNLVTGRFDDGLNVAQHFDFQHLPGRKWDGAYDPEGLLSSIPAIATCLLGAFAGIFLRNPKFGDRERVKWLLVAGVAGVALGFLWGVQFPVIKKLWTSSYVLVAGGYACLILGAFYQVIEIWGKRQWCTPFVWIGTNSITIYLAYHLIKFEDYAERIVGGPVQARLGVYGNLLIALVDVLMMFALVRFLYRRKIFLRF